MDEFYAMGLRCAGLAVLYLHEYLTIHWVVGTLAFPVIYIVLNAYMSSEVLL